MSPKVPPPRASGHTTRTGVPLYHVAYGPPEATRLLMLHGGPGAHHDYLLPQMLRLAEDYELILYDQRGGGRSQASGPQPVGWRTLVEDLALVIEELRLAPLSLLGYSWGGLLAMLYAVEVAHGRLDAPPPARMVLIDPAPVTRLLRDRFEAELARRQKSPEVQGLRDELAASGLRERDPAAYRQRVFELAVAGYFADPRAAQSLTPFRVTGRVQQSIWESLGDFDLLPELTAVRCPTLIVHGQEDPIPVESSAAAARALGARLIVLEESGHVPYVEQPEALFAAVLRFLEETDHLVSR